MRAKKAKLFPGARKSARATAAISGGSGRVTINKVPVEIVTPVLAREIILTPLELAGEYR